MTTAEQLVQRLLEETRQLANFSTGELCKEIMKRTQANCAIRITTKGVRVTHSRYLDKLTSAEQVDEALKANLFA